MPAAAGERAATTHGGRHGRGDHRQAGAGPRHGHHERQGARHRRRRPRPRERPAGGGPQHAAAGMGRAGRGGAVAGAAGHGARGAGQGRRLRLRHRGHRHRQPARDHHRVGPRARASRSRRRSSGRTGAPPRVRRNCAAGGPRRWSRRKTGLVLDAYFSGTKLHWLLDNVPGARARAEARRARVRHRRQLAGVAAHRWPRARDRRDATPRGRCSSTSARAPGTTSCWRCSASRARCCREVVAVSGVCGETDAGLLGAPIPIAGIAGDQQAALFGQACFARGHGQEHLRHRLLPAACNTGDDAVPSRHGLLTTVALAARRQARLRARGQRVHRRRRRAVAARRPAVSSARGARSRRSRASVTDSGGVLLRAGVRRARRAALGPGTRAAPSSASPAGPRRRTSPARRSRASPSRAQTCTRLRPTAPG